MLERTSSDEMKRSTLYVLLIQILLASQVLSISYGAIVASAPFVSLDKVTFPDHVLTGQEFTINVSITYSCKQRTMTNVGVYNYNPETLMDPRVVFLEGNGSRSFLFHVKAPLNEGDLKFEALLRYWHLGGWIYRNETLHRRFSLRAIGRAIDETVQVAIALPNPNKTPATIKWSGAEVRTDQLGFARINAKAGRYLVEIPQKMYVNNNTRLNFLRWDDGSSSNPRIIEIRNDMTLIPEYGVEHYLSVTSEIGKASGGGWYPNGSVGTFSASPSVLEYTRAIIPREYKFMKWSGDSDAEAPIAQVNMSSPKTVRALWQVDQTPGMIILASITIMTLDVLILLYIALRRRR